MRLPQWLSPGSDLVDFLIFILVIGGVVAAVTAFANAMERLA